ncbi:MAG: hybrid sensor histidine kinase/response regulator [Planctomycetota bacterium]|nr:hybrid sensor histidine kinase/response regulator [Planctomycetota bacterium]
MHDLFCMEVEAQTAVLNEGLLALEQGGASVGVEALMRAAHSVKGAARIIGLSMVVQTAHVLEDCFLAAKAGKLSLQPEQIDVLLSGVDLLARLAKVKEPDLASWLAVQQEEFKAKTATLERLLSGSPPPPPVRPAAEAPPPDVPAAAAAKVTPAPRTVSKEITPPAAVGEEPAKPQDSAAVTDAQRVVRVNAAYMNRLLSLAGQSLVQARWLEPFVGSLQQLKRGQNQSGIVLDRLAEALAAGDDERVRTLCAEAREQAARNARSCAERMRELDLAQRNLGNLTERLYHSVIASRMRPFADGVVGFPRMVRDLARQLGKQVRFEIEGKQTEVDREILEKLEAPLTHLLRNAVDHGLEKPDERRAAGKDATGSLRLEAWHRAGQLAIVLSDDGRGVDVERLREKIVARTMATAEMAGKMTEEELLEFLFLPGFSTKDNVTEVSGRGVGLDIVQTMVQEVGGTLRMETKPGRGATFQLNLPLTRSVLRSLLVEIAGEPYAFPLARVERCLQVSLTEVQTVQDRQYIPFSGQTLGLVAAPQVLGLPETPLRSGTVSVVVLQDHTSRYGLQVDRFLGERDLVVRPLDPRLGKVPDVSAAAVLEDGTPVLLLDVEDLLHSIDALLSSGRLVKVRHSVGQAGARKRKRILVVDDSITVREVERRLLENKGYDVDVAVNGADGWNAVRQGRYDLLITDVDMPRMNGIELVQAVKRDEVLRALPVMIVSYKDREEDRLLGLQAGANYYLAKSSFHDDSLLDAVTDLIGEANA